MSPITAACEFSNDNEALDVLTRAGITPRPSGGISVPTSVNLDDDQELASALEYLSTQSRYFWRWEVD